MNILVLNCGSSSIKYQVVDPTAETYAAKGAVERIGAAGARLMHDVPGRSTALIERPIPDYRTGIQLILDILTHREHGIVASLRDIAAVGHRVVHAGERYTGSVLVTDDVLDALRACIELAPLHNPANIAGIEAAQAAMPNVSHVAVFDNALHHTLPPHARTYALPYDLCQKHGVRRYGFHGIAFRSAAERASQLVGKPLEQMRVITLMLGSGCTANARLYGKSVDVSTGFTPLEGLAQSTRTGDVDAAAVLYLMEKEGLSPAQMSEVLFRKSGWLGMAGVGQDLRDVIAAAQNGNARAQLALDVFVYRCRKYVGAYAAAMGDVDLLIFTGGIGEKSPQLRARIASDLEFMGIALEGRRNDCVGVDRIISSDGSRATVAVVVVNEELVIARDTWTAARGGNKMG